MEAMKSSGKKAGDTFQFHQAVHIRPKGKPGKNFVRGVNVVPEDYQYDPYFLKLVSSGLIVEVDSTKLPPVNKSPQEIAADLHARIVSRKRGKEAPAMAARAAAHADEEQKSAKTVEQEIPATSTSGDTDGEDDGFLGKSAHHDKKKKSK